MCCRLDWLGSVTWKRRTLQNKVHMPACVLSLCFFQQSELQKKPLTRDRKGFSRSAAGRTYGWLMWRLFCMLLMGPTSFLLSCFQTVLPSLTQVFWVTFFRKIFCSSFFYFFYASCERSGMYEPLLISVVLQLFRRFRILGFLTTRYSIHEPVVECSQTSK